MRCAVRMASRQRGDANFVGCVGSREDDGGNVGNIDRSVRPPMPHKASHKFVAGTAHPPKYQLRGNLGGGYRALRGTHVVTRRVHVACACLVHVQL